MIFLVGASAIYLTATQAAINAPRAAFKTCLTESVAKASAQKVPADGYEKFVRESCGAQLNSFKSAVVGFDLQNKMSRKDATADAESMVADFVAGSSDHYAYLARTVSPKEATADAAAAPVKAVVTPASAPASPQPPK